MRWLLWLLLVLGLTACNRYRWDTPEAAYASFARAVQRGEYQVAYQALSAETRQAIAVRSREISQASGGALKDDPAVLAFASGVKPTPVSEVKVVKREDQVATVAVTAGGATQQQRMVKEGEQWKVDLSETFGR